MYSIIKNYITDNVPFLSKLRKYSLMEQFADTAAQKVLQLEKELRKLEKEKAVMLDEVSTLRSALRFQQQEHKEMTNNKPSKNKKNK